MTDIIIHSDEELTATEQNQLVKNQIWLGQIESETAKCHPDYGDGRKSYVNQTPPHKVQQDADGNWWVYLDKDPNGGWKQSLTGERLGEYYRMFEVVKMWHEITWSKEVEEGAL